MPASLEVLNQKVDSFKESQKDINDKLASTLDKLVDTVAEIKVYEASLNNMREDLTAQKQVTQLHSDRLSTVEHKTALNTEMRTDQKHIKMALIGAIIVAAVGFGASLLTPDNTITLSQETINRIKSTE